MGKCKKCKKKFEDRAIGTKTERKFCSDECRLRFNTKEYYEKHKKDEEFRKKRREYSKKYMRNRYKNDSEFRDRVRKDNRENWRKKRGKK